MIDYDELLDLVPEALARATAGLTPGAVDASREPVTASRSTVTGADVRLDVIDRILGLLQAAADATTALVTEFAELEPVRVDEWESTAPRILATDNETAVLATAAPLLAIIREHITDIETHPAAHHVTDHLDDLRPLVARARQIKQRPRKCPVCFIGDVWADLEHATGLCDGCGHVLRAEVWLTVSEAAQRLGVAPRTVRDWIAADAVDWKGDGKRRLVELGSARVEKQTREARRALNLPQSAG